MASEEEEKPKLLTGSSLLTGSALIAQTFPWGKGTIYVKKNKIESYKQQNFLNWNLLPQSHYPSLLCITQSLCTFAKLILISQSDLLLLLLECIQFKKKPLELLCVN